MAPVNEVSHTACDRLAELLARASGPEAFSASATAPSGGLPLEVRGVGPIKLPVSRAQAKQLCLLGRPAQYGQGERTLLDRGVRDTWEIPKSRVRIDKRRWAQTLLPVLERLGRELGLPAGRTLRAELHSMLVYAPGQFFLEHQDSEKEDAMVASLVVGLPSAFKGGALEVRHGGRTITYRGSKKALSFVAFYSDCRHQVRPVASGYRVVLTYNLLLRDARAGSAIDPSPELVDELARCLEEHFASPDGPDRLVYLLDHEYTPRGLDFTRLKGVDSHRAPLLRAAAAHAGCEVALALANVKETWSAYEAGELEPWRQRSRYRERDDWDDGEFDSFDRDGDGDGDGDDEYELDELIESEVTLESWSGSRSGRLERVNLHVGDDAVCASTPSGDLEPCASEYEGYMGNWGNTLDRWYRRGAVVLWPSSLDFAVRGQASPSSALDELSARTQKGDLADAREAAATLAPFWAAAAARVEARALFAKALRVARLLDEPALAAMLLRPFRLETLTSSDAKPLSALVGSYGERWTEELVTAWSQQRWFHPNGGGRGEWIASLPKLCLTLQQTGEAGAAAATLLLAESWGWAKDSIEEALELSLPSTRKQTLSELARPVAAILEGASTIELRNLRDEVIAVLRRDEDLVGCAIAVLRATPKPRWSATGLDTLAAHCSATLDARLARPLRATDDWSIELPQGCDCELCGELRVSLEDPTRTTFEWPLAKERRTHVHRRIDAAELPVAHQTRRTGRPYTLVLQKTDALFEREHLRRRCDEQDLVWLQRKPTIRTRRQTD